METGRKRKVEVGESSVAVTLVHFKTPRLAAATMMQKPADFPESSGNSMCESVGSVLASCCSSEEWNDLVEGSSKLVDLEETDESTLEFLAASTVDLINCKDRRETTPSNARPRRSNLHRPLQKMPSEAELEKFFATAERNLQEQFVHKYNYDIVKDMPTEGPYEWVEIQLKP